MLGCCEGHIEGTEGKHDTCDTKKGYKLITVDPRDSRTLALVQYRSATGEIYSDNEEIQKDLNETLNLNSDKHMLKINRKQLLNQVILQLRTLQKSGNWKKSTLEKVKQKYENKDENGQKIEYAGIALWYINKRLERAEK